MKRFISLVLIFCVLFSAIGVTINKHYCKKEGILFSSILGEIHCKCEKESKSVHSCCHKKKKSVKKKKGCCNKESEYHQLDTDYVFQIDSIDLNPNLLEIPQLFCAELISTSAFNKNEYINLILDDPPPIPNSDILIQYQSFLI